MLGKLIKYDLKETSRYLIPLHIFLLVTALLTRFVALPGLLRKNPDVISVLTLVLFIIVTIGVSLATQMIVGIRFYKHFFSDQGYLTFTLPVSAGQHLAGKTISGFLWVLFNLVFFCVTYCIAFITPSTLSIMEKEQVLLPQILSNVFGMTMNDFYMFLAITILLGAISAVVFLYACIAIGQLFSSHKILAAVIAYFTFTMLLQIITLILLLVGNIGTGFSALIEPGTKAYAHYMQSSINLSFILSTIQTVIFYIVTQLILRKKINLI